MKKIKTFIPIIEGRRNNYEISYGNLEVLKTIPEMMNDKQYRDKLRKLVLDYKTKEILKHGKGKMFSK